VAPAVWHGTLRLFRKRKAISDPRCAVWCHGVAVGMWHQWPLLAPSTNKYTSSFSNNHFFKNLTKNILNNINICIRKISIL
jgi:hypothetical protein